jgi:hypothetical protein
MHILFFLLAAYIAFSIFSRLTSKPNKEADLSQQPRDAWTLSHQNDWTFITAETVDWKSIYFDRSNNSGILVDPSR